MIQKVIFTIAAFTILFAAEAQTITGTVKTRTGKAVELATIKMLNTEISKVSDKKGGFVFSNLTPGT